MADEFEKAEGRFCVICFGEVIHLITAECGHTICMSCFKKKTSCSSCCTACWELSQQRTPQDGLAIHPEGEGMCKIHMEDQKLFCDHNKTLFCVTCNKSDHHETHIHWSIEEAALHYREKIQINLETLYKMEKEAQELLLKGKEQPLLWTVIWISNENRKRSIFQKIFKQIWEYLTRKKEKEKVIVGKKNKKLYGLYQKLKNMDDTQEQQIMKEKKKWEATMSSQTRFLTDIIIDLEEKMQKPDVDMLQDVAETLERSSVWMNLEPFILNVDDSYLSVVTEFLQLFQRYKLSERRDFYNLSEEKERAIRIVPGYSNNKYPAYVFGSVQAEDIRRRIFIIQT